MGATQMQGAQNEQSSMLGENLIVLFESLKRSVLGGQSCGSASNSRPP